MNEDEVVSFGERPVSVEALHRIASGEARAAISEAEVVRERIDASVALIGSRLSQGLPTYGVNTGFGHAVGRSISVEEARVLARNLVRYHGCGTGPMFTEEETAAIVASRLASLARGYSGIRFVVLERMCELLNRRVLPLIPSEGSVGASGDLTPLSYVAALLVGEREATLDGERVTAEHALAQVGLQPLTLEPKESLALMNGTSVMVGLLVLVVGRAERLARLSAAATAVACDVMHGEPKHFDARIFELKAHRGTTRAAEWIRSDLAGVLARPVHLQSRYSIRCAPHVIGVLLDALESFRPWLDVELNSVNDNPIVDPENDDVLHGGNFYGGHLCFIADGLKTAVASVAELMERQLLGLCDGEVNDGLPASLMPGDSPIHHGFKAMQISASALVAEALKLTMPASSFSRSTENNNQDKVSMGTIAARDCLRILELAETVAAIHIIALTQAAELRGEEGRALVSQRLRTAVRRSVEFARTDRPFDTDIASILAALPSLHRAIIAV